MQTLIFSDTHLDKHFERSKYTRLRELISQSDQVIINGDFWEGYGMSFDEFLSTQWASLFPLLKQKNTVYIYGNHDKKQFSDDRVYWFCNTVALQYEMTVNGTTYIFEHGDRFASKIDGKLGIERAKKISFLLSEWLQKKFVQILGINGLRILFGQLNPHIKRKINIEFQNKGNFVYVCGHTDCAEIDLPNHFANGGICKFGYLQYLTLDENGQLHAYNETY